MDWQQGFSISPKYWILGGGEHYSDLQMKGIPKIEYLVWPWSFLTPVFKWSPVPEREHDSEKCCTLGLWETLGSGRFRKCLTADWGDGALQQYREKAEQTRQQRGDRDKLSKLEAKKKSMKKVWVRGETLPKEQGRGVRLQLFVTETDSVLQRTITEFKWSNTSSAVCASKRAWGTNGVCYTNTSPACCTYKQ